MEPHPERRELRVPVVRHGGPEDRLAGAFFEAASASDYVFRPDASTPAVPVRLGELGARVGRGPLAICVLGCSVGTAAFARRVRGGRAAFQAIEDRVPVIVACGGCARRGRTESDVIAKELVALGVPAKRVVRERCSLDTRDNARFARAILRRHEIRRVLVVTCEWHLPRAMSLFERTGVTTLGLGVVPPSPKFSSRVYWAVREQISSWKDRHRHVELR